MDLLVTYDIDTGDREGQRRLARVAKVCESYGVRVQYSVFECRLTEVAELRLRHELEDLIKPAVDSVRFYRIPGSLENIRTSLGRDIPHTWGEPWIL
ncbi:MAG: CRISPR-associated endonuclease Cas2 [Candidatus Bipolaricaulia bacterium]